MGDGDPSQKSSVSHRPRFPRVERCGTGEGVAVQYAPKRRNSGLFAGIVTQVGVSSGYKLHREWPVADALPKRGICPGTGLF